MPLHDDASIAGYNNKTMVGNWWEDRLNSKLNSTGDRIFARDAGGRSEFKTTKQEQEENMLRALPGATKRLVAPSLYSTQPTLQKALETYMPGGQPPDSVAFTLGSTKSKSHEQHLQTTNQYFFKELPQQIRSTQPAQVTDRTFFRSSPVTAPPKDTASQHIVEGQSEPLGSKGSRGEITRNPKEAGNPYGVSVFVDEYARWGTKLAGLFINSRNLNPSRGNSWPITGFEHTRYKATNIAAGKWVMMKQLSAEESMCGADWASTVPHSAQVGSLPPSSCSRRPSGGRGVRASLGGKPKDLVSQAGGGI